jgi:hypothetical protein
MWAYLAVVFFGVATGSIIYAIFGVHWQQLREFRDGDVKLVHEDGDALIEHLRLQLRSERMDRDYWL